MRIDPHSYADLTQAKTTHIDLHLSIDFEQQRLEGLVTLFFETPAQGVIDLDTRGLEVASIEDEHGTPVSFELGPLDSVLGNRLRLHLSQASAHVRVHYRTGEEALALMWLSPEQTAGGVHPFVLTQCQAIHARTVVPLQDTPMARITYAAKLTVPGFATAVMSAAPKPVERLPDGRRTFPFEMPQPIPPYLLAFAVGELASAELGPRCRVFAEPVRIEAAAWEFADVESMLTEAEDLFGPFAWERYDFIVLPPSFPLGGMENPRMTFLTPTLIAGDRSLVGVLAHELAHSWTGNLVTNAHNEHFWLNEGWTVWAERRILERLYGVEEATQQAMLGRVKLEAVVADRQQKGLPTALVYDQTGLDPDAEFSKIPYEKGFLVITALERAVGRERFDRFVRDYIAAFQFQSISTQTFIDFVHEHLPEADSVDLSDWVHQEGVPAEAPRFHSARLEALAEIASEGGRFTDHKLSTTEKLYLLSQMPASASAPQIRDDFEIAIPGNAELASAWLAFAIRTGTPGLESEISALVDSIGRTKLILPLYRAMSQSPLYAAFGSARFAANEARLHSSTAAAIRREC